jgi:hypothetical protein
MLKYISALLILMGWTLYIGASGYVLVRMFNGETPKLILNAGLGLASGWITVGIMLFAATAWWDEEFTG